ncbi:MAG: GAF domain-containing protein [Anaerolineales bacterium]|nr:GAF domain-containing protein [Anaerolineales bacterium]
MLIQSQPPVERLAVQKRTAAARQHEGFALSAESQNIEELAALAIAGAGIASNLEVDKVLQIIAQQLTRLLDVPLCVVSDWKQNNGGFHTRVAYANSQAPKRAGKQRPATLANELGLSFALEDRGPLQIKEADPLLSKKEKQAFKKAGVQALLLLPLVAQNQTVGAVELQETRRPRGFTEAEIYLAQTLCHQAAVAMENARLFESSNRQIQELSILYQVATAASEATHEDELIERATGLIRENLYPDNFGVIMLDRDGKRLRIHPSYQGSAGVHKHIIELGQGVTGQVALSGKPRRVADVRRIKNYLDYDDDTLSELCVPMKVGGRVIGVINAESKTAGHFTEKDERVLLTFAGQLASGIERLRNAAAEQRRAKQLDILNKLTAEMSGVLERDKLFKIVVERLTKDMNYASTDISLVDEENREFHVVEASGNFSDLTQNGGYRQPFGQGLFALAHESGEVVVANNLRDWPQYHCAAGHEAVQSELIIPIKIYKRVVALLNVESDAPNAFDEHEVAALATLCEHISVALESINLFDSTRRQLQELTVLHAITHAAVSAPNEEELLERATEIIGDSVYPDQFGFLMLEPDGRHLAVNKHYRGISEKQKKRRVHLSQGVVGKVSSSGKPWRVPDVREEPSYLNVSRSMRSELCVPILGNNNRVLGVINAESAQLDAFSDKDERLLHTIAAQLGTAIEKLRLFEAERVQREQAETLREMAVILSSETESAKVFELILEQLNKVVPFDSASIQVIKDENLRVQAVAGKLSEGLIGHEMPVTSASITHPLIFEHRTMLYGDVHDHPGWVKVPGVEKIVSWIGAPLVARGRCIGILTVDGYRANQFTHKDAQLVSVFATHAAIAMENARLFEGAQEAYVQTVTALASAIDVRDSYTSGHSRRLAELAVKTGELMGCSDGELLDILWGGLLHDIGKIGVPDEILRKPESLTPEEEEIMRQHPEIGAHIVEGVKNLAGVAPIIRAHQERYDGMGYPDALRGEQIPKVARIISVADAYVAMTDERVYRKSLSHAQAVRELKAHSGTQFDPAVVKAFLKVVEAEARPKAK